MKPLDKIDGDSVVKPLEPDTNHNLMRAQLAGGHRRHSIKPLKRGAKAALLAIAVLSLFVTLGLAARSEHKPAFVVQGEVQATEIKVVPKVVGRVQTVHVCKGEKVSKGQLLVTLENQELQARLEQARAAMELAKEHNRVVQAVCLENIRAQSNLWVQAKAVVEHAEQAVSRSRALQASNVISLQELQDLERNLDWARCSEQAAKASFELAVTIFGDEGKKAVAAHLEQASQRVAELEALVAELAVTSPIDGEVRGQIVVQGDLAGFDLPLVSIVDPQEVWVAFNVTEELVSNIRIGTTLHVQVPGLGNREVPVTVKDISPNGSVVTGLTGTGTQGFALRTFQVRAVPVQVTQGLRPGMSALSSWPTRG